jgi:predicted AlkP superfamily phosphohydrolase/phosphomutase
MLKEGELATKLEPGDGKQQIKTLVLGLDGMTMTLLSPLMAKGILPNMSQLLANGVQAILKSTIPPFTGPAWVSIITGVNPGRHGIYGFGAVDAETGAMSLARTEHIASPRLWQLINAHGLTTGVVNVPLIYPPDPVDGFMLTGMLTPPETDHFAYPLSATRIVHEALGEEYLVDVGVTPAQHAHDTSILSRLAQLLRHREQAVHALLDHILPDFLMLVLVIPDRLQHLYWGYLLPSGPDDPVYYSAQAEAFRTEIEALYGEIDSVVGRLLERLGPACRTFVVSDHGFSREERVININNWLYRQGWLKLHSGGGVARSLKGILLRTPGARWIIHKLQRGRISRSFQKTLINWPKTLAYAGTVFQQGIYINLKGRQPHGCVEPGAAYESLRQEIAAGLAELRDPQSNEPLFERVYLQEEIFHGPYVERAPDLLPVVRGSNGLLAPGFGDGNLVHYQNDQPYGCHHPDGILVASGPGIRSGVGLPVANVLDITPTVLHSLGLPVPCDLDGKVLESIFEPDELSSNPPQTDDRTAAQVVASLTQAALFDFDADDSNQIIIERLRALGYL